MTTHLSRRTLALATLLLAVLAVPALAAHRHARRRAAASTLRIDVLSDRADLISGGDALVAIDLPAGTRSARVTLNGADVSNEFAQRPNGRYEGLVSGLRLGANTLGARAGGDSATQTIVDHPIGGPVFSGPQVQPWQCEAGAADQQCNKPTTYQLLYMPAIGGGFQSYDPSSPPPAAAIATTTTDQGKTVPFIIRQETGYQDRDQYQISVLYQPGQPWSPWDPQAQWNHKLLITHGASCGIEHQSGSAPSTTSDTVGVPGGPGVGDSPTTALGRGFAVMSTALDNSGHNCNLVTQAESLVMAKEHLVEEYGTIRYTIGTGCSGGSLAQQHIANAYPGIYQGILPQCSFPDAWSTGQQLASYHLLRLYEEDPSKWAPGVIWTPAQIAAVEGHPNHVNAIVFDSVYWTDLAVPDDGCAGVPAQDDYNAQTNPGGVRCDLADYMINVLGPREPQDWSPMEKAVGHGFGGLPFSDVGMQFGLEALQKGEITPQQFVDLNAKVGGEDVDIKPTAARTDAVEPALRNAYLSGAINETNNMKDVAIIDLRGPDPGAFHDAYRSWAIRARLEREEGHFPKNDVIWFGETPLIGDPNYTTQGLLAMDRWLSAVEADHRDAPLSQKIADDRPADVHDQCSNIPGVDQVNLPGVGEVCQNQDLQTRFATPAMVAGEGVATDTNRCQLKPLRREDYYPLAFTDAEWAQLEQAFPTGVCDWSKPGVDQTGAVPWRTYQDAAGGVIYGGTPLGPSPNGSGDGWTSGSFAGWRAAGGTAAVRSARTRHHRRARHRRRR
jgi:hypothetical protein